MNFRRFLPLLWGGVLAAAAACAGSLSARSTTRPNTVSPCATACASTPRSIRPRLRGDAPIIIFRTPYGTGPYGADAFPAGLEKGYLRSYVDRGYIIVQQDVRGRYMSEGEFMHVRPVGFGDVDEATDSYDTVEWLVKHIPGNNGRVGFAGSSYPGFYALMGGPERSPCGEGRLSAGACDRLVHG